MNCSTPGLPVHHQLSVRVYPNPCPSSWWCHPTISFSVVPFSSRPQSFPASGLFKWVSSLHQGPKYWSFSFNISPSNEYPGLISFRMDWLDPLGCKWMSLSIFEHTFIYKNSVQYLSCGLWFSKPYSTSCLSGCLEKGSTPQFSVSKWPNSYISETLVKALRCVK